MPNKIESMNKNILTKVKKKIGTYRIQIACKYDEIQLNRMLNHPQPNHRIYLFGSPNQVNLGDQAQTYCIEKWLKANFPNYEIFIFTYYTITDRILSTIRKTIKPQDKIIIHSGYHITDLYNMVDKYCKIIELFHDFKIIVMPQTVNFLTDKDKERIVADTFNAHPDITLLCRDELSYDKAKKIFPKCKLLLFPDIVTSLIGTRKYTNERDGILFCIRNDKESFYGKKDIRALMDKLSPIKTDITDTDSPLFYRKIQQNREKVLEAKWNEFSKYKVTITDRYHGTIFSLIANTPVIVLSSTDHKLSSGVKWFPKEFGNAVTFASNLDEAYKMAIQRYDENTYEHQLPPYFKDNYYSKLTDKL